MKYPRPDYLLFIILLSTFVSTKSENKYSAQANSKISEPDVPASFRTLDKPFRMNKINMLWSKAQLRLTESKLKSLFMELKIHDKELLAQKRFRSDGGDKDGLKEADLRKKLVTIMSTFGLLEHFEDVDDPSILKPHKSSNDMKHINNSLFKDKKLNLLWEKAERAGFSAEELQALQEEFGHHQDKIDQYYSLMKDVEHKDESDSDNSVDEKLNKFNTIDNMEQEETPDKRFRNNANTLRNLHHQLKDGYDRLDRIAAKGPNSKEFIEPRVQGLWKLASEANFTPEELESLKTELLHYENRLLKLRHLHAEAELNSERRTAKLTGSKPSQGLLLMEDTIKKHERKVEKLRMDLETRIMQKHIEL